MKKKIKKIFLNKKKVKVNALRISVFRSNKHIYAQVIDDIAGHTVCSCSSLDKKVKLNLKTLTPQERAFKVGEALGLIVLDLGIRKCILDLGTFRYHGRIKSFVNGLKSFGIAL